MSEKDKALGAADDAAQQPVTAELAADVTSVNDGAAMLTDPHRYVYLLSTSFKHNELTR